MLKKVSCPSCGSSLKPDAYYCDYCGTFFENKKSQLETEQFKRFEQREGDSKTDSKVLDRSAEKDLYAQDNFVSTEEIENSKLKTILISYNNLKENNGVWSVIMIFLFFFIFMSSAVFEVPFVSIIIVIILANAINAQKEKKKELIKLYEKGAYIKAYSKLNETPDSQSNVNIIKQKVLLCYYRLDKKQEAIRLIETLNKKPHIKDEHINDVAKKLSVIYEPKEKFNL